MEKIQRPLFESISEIKYKFLEGRPEVVGFTIIILIIHNFTMSSTMHPVNWTESNSWETSEWIAHAFAARVAWDINFLLYMKSAREI